MVFKNSSLTSKIFWISSSTGSTLSTDPPYLLLPCGYYTGSYSGIVTELELPSLSFLRHVVVAVGLALVDMVYTNLLSRHTFATKFPHCRKIHSPHFN